jgi:predicted PurR-regulated permease PerM
MEEQQRGDISVSQFLRAVLVAGVLFGGGWVIYTIGGTLLPFGLAFVLSYILVPVVDYMESHRVNRMVSVAAVMVSMLGIFILAVATFIPVLITGMGDMTTQILGDRPVWDCVIANRGWDEVTFSGVEASPPFIVEEGAVPLKLAPGAQDTISIEFAPDRPGPAIGTVLLRSDDPGVEPLILRVSGNLSGHRDVQHYVPTYPKDLGQAHIAINDSVHAFGAAETGYMSQLKMQIQDLQPELQKVFPKLGEVDLASTVSEKIQGAATEVLKETPALLGSVLSGITFVVIVPLVLFFFLAEGRAIKRAFIEMIPNKYFEMVLNLIYRIDQQLGGYVRGMVMSVVIISALSIFGLWSIGLRDYMVVGTIAGVANVIPYLGPLIGIIAGTVSALLQYSTLGWGTILPVIGVFLVIQLLDNIFVQPVVVARAVNLHPLVVIFVVLVGSQMFGAMGMLLAVPMTAVIKVAVQTIYEGLRSYSVT